MKRIVLLLVITLGLVSCSDDDSKSSRNLYLQSIVSFNGDGTPGGAIDFDYDDKGQLVTVSGIGSAYNIGYEDGRIVSVLSTTAGAQNYKLTYENGKLTSLKQNDTAYDVEISSDGKKYTIAGLQREFTINDNNDIASITEVAETYPFNYDNDHKGPMYNVKTENFYLLQFLLSAPYLLSRRPAVDYLNFTTKHTYNSDGYIEKTELSSEGSSEPASILHYNYTEL